jgi:hypothetical protein
MNDALQILEHPGGRTMTTIGPTFPAHIAVSQAQARLVADQTANADASIIKLDEQSVQIAEQIERDAEDSHRHHPDDERWGVTLAVAASASDAGAQPSIPMKRGEAAGSRQRVCCWPTQGDESEPFARDVLIQNQYRQRKQQANSAKQRDRDE